MDRAPTYAQRDEGGVVAPEPFVQVGTAAARFLGRLVAQHPQVLYAATERLKQQNTG